MVDYECPACGGGFPASAVATADACPWCGESMDGDDGDDRDPFLPSTPTTEPLHPFWDSGIRCRDPELGTPDPEDLSDPDRTVRNGWSTGTLEASPYFNADQNRSGAGGDGL